MWFSAIFFFSKNAAVRMGISDRSSDGCSSDRCGHLSLKIGFAQLAGEDVREYFVERQPWARRQGKAGTKGFVIGAGEEIPQPFGQSSGVEPIFVDQQFGFDPDADIFHIQPEDRKSVV